MSTKESSDSILSEQEPPGDSATINDLLTTLHVAILYSDVKREYFATEQLYIAEKDADKYARNIADVLIKMGVKVD
ncbi:hypothetical protein KC573_02510 [candidate division WWE3 bacterium]|uniref:Uncharacterized protein n=1 Tax=candidate division WWE3 bacterium TaxID=2053526 RepID=A0A955RX19_UNCKA|nr:hypothetical protein [candidate division WWE3 bacterium]